MADEGWIQGQVTACNGGRYDVLIGMRPYPYGGLLPSDGDVFQVGDLVWLHVSGNGQTVLLYRERHDLM